MRTPHTRTTTPGTWPGWDNTRTARAARERLRAATTTDRRLDAYHHHAALTWRRITTRTALQLTSPTATNGLIDLDMAGRLATHIATCTDCTAGPRGWRPIDWLTWAVHQRPGLQQVIAPALLEHTGTTRPRVAIGPTR